MHSKVKAQGGFDALPVTFAQFDKLLALIYDGPLEEVPWQKALEAIREYFDGNFALLILRPTSAQEHGLTVIATGGRTVVTTAHYYEYGYSLDTFINLPTDRVVTVDEIVGTEQWLNSEFYKQFVETSDIRYIMGADIRTAGGIDCRFRICRPQAAGEFSAGDKALGELLLPHFKRAVHLHSHLDVINSERALYASAVDRMLVGTVIFDETGKILEVNCVAQEIFAEKDGIVIANGTLQASYNNENRELQRLIKDSLIGCASHSPFERMSEAVALTRPSGRAKLGVLIRRIPLSEWSEGKHRPAVVIFIRDPDRKSEASADLMRRLFDFTPAEASLALLLASGMTLDEAADQLNIRKNTGRAHLRAIFSKTGVTRQTALVHVLLNSVLSLH